MPRYKQLNYREIDVEQVKQIMKGDFVFFGEVITNVFCSTCFVTRINDYGIYLDGSGDIILQGHCSKCGKKVARVIETGEDPATAKRANKIYKQLKGRPIPEKIRSELIEKTDKYLKDMQSHYKEKKGEMPLEDEKEWLDFMAETQKVNKMLKKDRLKK